MKITDNINWKIVVGDIETFLELTDLGFYNPDENKWYEFEISNYKNELYEFIKFYNKNDWDYVIGYNYINFDAQVIQFILSNYESWNKLKNLEITKIIYEFVQNLIDNQSYNENNKPYKESIFEIKVIDVFTIFGLNNEARRSSLKKCEFQIDWYSVEEMPINHSKENLSIEEINKIREYRKNDILATFELFKISIGDTNINIYNGKNIIELRLDIKEEFDIDCINMSDIKLGEELIKKTYAEAIGKEVKDLPRKGFFRKSIYLKDCIPSYVEFKTDYFNSLLNSIKKKVISQREIFEIPINFYNRKYTLARGGLHADQKNEIWEASEDYIIEDWDVSSYYPKIIINNNIFPQHLGKELLITYTKQYNKRLELKPFAKKDKKAKAIVEAIKLMLNIIFGKMGSMESWLYDAKALFSVTLTGEFSLLMLIEEFELNDIRVISSNTDGITIKYHKDKEQRVKDITNSWMEKTNFELESARFKKFYYQSVNDYWGIKEDGEIKKKGDALTDFELYKNKSSKIIPLALEEYFVNRKDPIDFIKNHKNIYDFCIMAKANGKMYLEMQKEEDGQIDIRPLNKLVRYYISSDSNWQLFKRGIGAKGQIMNKHERAPNEFGEQYIQYFNQFEQKEDYKINYDPYILKTLSIIDAIEKTNRKKEFIESKKVQNQLTLF